MHETGPDLILSSVIMMFIGNYLDVVAHRLLTGCPTALYFAIINSISTDLGQRFRQAAEIVLAETAKSVIDGAAAFSSAKPENSGAI